MEVPLSTEICRCCLAPGNYKSLKDTFQWMGQNENYGDMLKECFNVTLCDANDSCHGGICELCITQLRNARNFKKQVLKSDEIFKQGLDNNFKGEEVKIEFLNENDLDSDTGNQDDYFAGLETEEETEVPVKEEITVATKSRKRTVERKVPVKNDAPAKKKKPEGETSGKGINTGQNGTYLNEIRRCLRNLPECTTVKCNLSTLLKYNNVISYNTSTTLGYDSIDSSYEEHERIKRTEMKSYIRPEYLKYRRNLITLLTCSNATPFRDRTILGYLCAYCPETFPHPDDLRTHTRDGHDSVRLEYKAHTSVNELTVLVDITDLKCTICETNFRSLKTLTDHLLATHEREYYRDVPDFIHPFKLTYEKEMGCCLCSEVFDNFKGLATHMNSHHNNFVCGTCGVTFSNLSRLTRHEKTHENGKYPCQYCTKVYSTPLNRRNHERVIHLGHTKCKCPMCNQKFRTSYQRAKHMVASHGAELLKCSICERLFFTKAELNSHVRRSHLKEKSHECSICQRRFFLNVTLQQHYRRHVGEKPFDCEFCGRKFTRKSECNLHIKKFHK